LPSIDDLFSTQAQRDESKLEKIVKIPIKDISDFPDHPFKVRKDKDMERLVDSVREKGILVPTIVRQKEDGTYEMISGHRRKLAASIAGLTEIDAIVKNLTDDEATILMVDSNIQREEILPSEKAFSLKMKLDALKHQGKKIDLEENETSDQDGPKFKRSNEILSEQIGESITQIKRYIRLTYLIPELLEKVDSKDLGLSQAEHLSFLDDEFQYLVLNKMEYDEISPSVGQAIKLKKMYQEGRLTEEKLENILNEVKPNQQENQHIKYKELRQYFPQDYSNDKIKSVIQDFLQDYFKKWHDKERNDAR